MGYANDGSGTRSIMDILAGGQRANGDRKVHSPSDTAPLYKALVRQLPPKDCIDELVRFFFAEISWQYDVVDESIFWEQLLAWRRVPYAAYSQPQVLDPEIRCFPALLFQVLAQAVLSQPHREDGFLDDLRSSPDMDLRDLAAEFSDAGHQILSILGPTDSALVRVQAGLHRAVFLKMTGSVLESWHVLGNTIRDAQELGLHRLYSSSTQNVPSEREQGHFVIMGRRTWLVLHLWDAHMGVILGRPMVTKMDPGIVPLPHGLRSAGADDAGTAQQIVPFDMLLCGYHAAYKYLQDIHKLDPREPEAFAMADLISATIVAGIGEVPEWARSSDPGQDDQCPWLPFARETLVTELQCTLLALHRPFIFLRAQNRTDALKAALRILESQSKISRMSDPQRYPGFEVVFALFDATVIVAAIYILFPGEYPEYLQTSLGCVQWAVQRLHAMKAQSTLAASAHTASHEIYQNLLVSISDPQSSLLSPPTTASRGSQDSTGQPFPGQMGFADLRSGLASGIPQDLANLLSDMPRNESIFPDSIHAGEAVAKSNGASYAAAHGFDFEKIVPPLPLRDLISVNATNDVPFLNCGVMAGGVGEAHGGAPDFWQVLDAFSKAQRPVSTQNR